MEDKSLSTQVSTGMLYGIRDRVPGGMATILAIQHVFAMFGATILVPILVNQQASAEVLAISAALTLSGVGTLIYQACTKCTSPVYLGSSFAFITPVATAYIASSIGGAMTGLLTVGVIYMVFAAVCAIIGNGWIDRLLPPIVYGPMIMVIGLSLASSAISQIGINAGAESDPKSLIVALVTLLTAIFVMVCSRGFFRVIPFLVAIVVGYIVSICFGMVDFTGVKEAAWFALPGFNVVFVDYQLDFSAIWQIAPVALVTIPEHIGDHKALSTTVGTDLLKKPGLARTLLGDGLATFVAACFGGPANTTYGENTAVVGMTKIASVHVIRLAAIFAVIMGFLGKFTALISAIPNPVLGGVSVLLYGFIALSGAKVWVRDGIDFDIPRNIAIAAPMLVLGLGGANFALPIFGGTVTFSGMSLAAICGIILNLILPENGKNGWLRKLGVRLGIAKQISEEDTAEIRDVAR